MAKVRIQAGSAGGETLPTPATSAAGKKPKGLGAVELLTKVWKEDGPTGWYQVPQFHNLIVFQVLRYLPGNECSDHQSRPFTGVVVHVEGAIRAIRFSNYSFV